MAVMLVVALYLASTAPMLPLLLVVHNLRSDYTRLFQAAVILQLVPIGLVFVPLGFVGVGMLSYSLFLTIRRNRHFRRAGFDNPAVLQRWTREYAANLLAWGFALEQKGFALLFMEVSARHDVGWFLRVLVPASALLWTGLFVLVRRERAILWPTIPHDAPI